MKCMFWILLFLIPCVGNAQANKDSLISVMSKEVCIDFGKKDLSKIKKENLEMEMGMLMLPTMTKHDKDIKAVYGSDYMNAMKEMAYDLGIKLAADCEVFRNFLMENQGAIGKKNNLDEPPSIKVVSDNSFTGVFISINPGDITTVSIKDAKGKLSKLYWMDYFENADSLMKSTSKFTNKKVTVGYTEKEVYNAAQKNYKTIKVITSIELE